MSTIAPSSAPLARSTDPVTSDKAAESLNPKTLGAQMEAILEILREHPAGLDDHQLARIYFRHAADKGWPMTFQDSIRKRRAQLARDGHVVGIGTHTNPNTHREMTIWTVAR